MEMLHQARLQPSDIDEAWFSAQEINSLMTALRQEGVDSDFLLSTIGLGDVDLNSPDTQVSARQRIAAFRFALQNSNNQNLALHCGSEMTVANYGLWGYALMCYPSLGESLDFAYQHLRLAGPVMTKSMSTTDTEVVFRAVDSLDLGALFPFAIEMWWSSIYALLKNDVLNGNFSLNSITVSYAKPAHWREYEKVFSCPIQFNANHCELRFSKQYLLRKPHLSNLLTAKTCQSLCGTMLSRLSSPTPLVTKVRNILLIQQDQYPSLSHMAQTLNTSARSFRRHLQNEGSTYQKLVNETRFTLAEQYLACTDLSVKQISNLVCFSDRANFQSAFKKWSGQTPINYRQQAKLASG